MKFLWIIVRSGWVLVASVLAFAPARADDRLPLDGTINGHAVHLAMDTGTSVPLVLFQSVAEGLGLKTTEVSDEEGASPRLGNVVSGFTEPVVFQIAGKSFNQARFYVLEDPPSPAFDVQGMVGWPMFKESVVQLKLAEQKVSVGLDLPPESLSWPKLVVRGDNEVLCVELPAEAGASHSLVLIDTGDPDGVSFSPEKWRQWKASHPGHAVTLSAEFMPGAGLGVKEESWADELTLGGLVLRGVVVKESNIAQVQAGGPGYVASLGLRALRRLDVVIDGGAGVAYVRPRTDPPLAFAHNRLGAVFIPRTDQSDELVARVVEGSPAALAGIRNDDQLLAIDHIDVTKWRTQPEILPFSKYWEQDAGRKVVLMLKRGDQTLSTTATLKNILGPAGVVDSPPS
jgi:PDZ domain